PESAPRAKVEKLRTFKVNVHLEGATYDDAHALAMARVEKTGATYVHAFDDRRTAAGQGTVGLEILDELPDVGAILVPVAGGGLGRVDVGCRRRGEDRRPPRAHRGRAAGGLAGPPGVHTPGPAAPRVPQRSHARRRHRGRDRRDRVRAPRPDRRDRARLRGGDRGRDRRPHRRRPGGGGGLGRGRGCRAAVGEAGRGRASGGGGRDGSQHRHERAPAPAVRSRVRVERDSDRWFAPAIGGLLVVGGTVVGALFLGALLGSAAEGAAAGGLAGGIGAV